MTISEKILLIINVLIWAFIGWFVFTHLEQIKRHDEVAKARYEVAKEQYKSGQKHNNYKKECRIKAVLNLGFLYMPFYDCNKE